MNTEGKDMEGSVVVARYPSIWLVRLWKISEKLGRDSQFLCWNSGPGSPNYKVKC